MKTSLLVLIVCIAIAQSSFPVKRVVVLMMENRSFDHMLGWLKNNDSRIDGLTGKEFNHYNVSDPTSKIEKVNQHGYNTGPDDPCHSWDCTGEEIYGHIIHHNHKGTPTMSGFVQNALRHHHTPYNPMSMFTPKTAPIINTLAHEFAVFDKWHCSIPGPTDPNRAFAMSGTSDGVLENFNGTRWGQQSYFDFLGKHKISWKAHYQDDPWAIMYFEDMHTKHNSQHVSELTEFFKQVDAGDLPQFTWLQPRMTSHKGAPTWQHPDASVAEGERLMKEVYEKLRNSKFWNEVALVITYDEHGGFYDHVPPPQKNVPSPDGVKARNGFEFDRLGIRVPAVVISPWIPRSTVVHEPNGPTPYSHYDATSVMATCNKLFGINGHLGKRSAWAGTFENIFSLKTPRTDCPKVLQDIPPFTEAAMKRQHNLPLNDHLEIQVAFYCKFNNHGPDCGKDITNQLEASLFIGREAEIFMNRVQSGTQE